MLRLARGAARMPRLLLENRNRLLESAAREAFALGPHIIAAQLAQSISHKFSGDSLPPGHVEIRVIQRLGDSRREGGSILDCALI